MAAPRLFTTWVLCLMTYLCVVGGQRLKNVALRKPALHHGNAGFFGAHAAVDGRRSNYMGSGSCSQSSTKKQAWWMVDLLASYQVQAIILTNMFAAGDNLRNFSVYVSPENPQQTPQFPEVISGHLCFYYGPPFPPHTKRVPCTTPYPTGRYVTVYLPVNLLRLCEVQVMAKTDFKWLDFQLFPDAKSSTLPFLSIYSVTSGVTCAQYCFAVRTRNKKTATAMQYQISTGQCQCIHMSELTSTTPGFSTHIGWNLYVAK